jgi:hypothetical protein
MPLIIRVNRLLRSYLRVQPMEMGNGVTPSGPLGGQLPPGVGANRMRLGKRMPEEANAWGNAQDRLTSGR